MLWESPNEFEMTARVVAAVSQIALWMAVKTEAPALPLLPEPT